MRMPNVFTHEEAKFLAEYRDLCERHGMCPIVESEGMLGLVNIAGNRMWGCTAGQMVDNQIEEMAKFLRQLPDRKQIATGRQPTGQRRSS